MGMYRIRGKNNLGWTIELTTTSESEQDLICEARKAAQAMALRNGAKSGSSTLTNHPSQVARRKDGPGETPDAVFLFELRLN